MLWLMAFHIISLVAWFAGLFYLPRLFVYHAQTTDVTGQERFKIMERKLYRFIMTPAALLTSGLGIFLLSFNLTFYLQQKWMLVKLAAVVFLWAYHLYCGHLVKAFNENHNSHSSTFYRWFNEIPSILLILIVIMVVVKPQI
ncbi:MAG TPA: protoporphyrinogen oxidase HemJ [Coxiellaceae bacterium]|nr:protoporphyrinogen oxidase HemJ [Coxiellaceae bacterium]